MNAGAYGGQMSDVIVESIALNKKSGEVLPIREHGFDYRHSVYMENKELMNSVRAYIEKAPVEFMEAYLSIAHEFTLYVEPNKRIKVPEGIPDVLVPWYTAKNFYLEKEITDFDLICSPDLVKEIEEGYLRLKPLYESIRVLQPDLC